MRKKKKFETSDIFFAIAVVITLIGCIIYRWRTGSSIKVIYPVLAGIEIVMYCLYAKSRGRQILDHKDEEVYEMVEIPYNNPLQDEYEIMRNYCNKLELAEYGKYKIVPSTKKKDELDKWEEENLMLLPKGYKDWLLLCEGAYDIHFTEIRGLEEMVPHPTLDQGEYFIVGSVRGDGTEIVIDRKGGFFEYDASTGLAEVPFEDFIQRWIIKNLSDCMVEAGLK